VFCYVHQSRSLSIPQNGFLVTITKRSSKPPQVFFFPRRQQNCCLYPTFQKWRASASPNPNRSFLIVTSSKEPQADFELKILISELLLTFPSPPFKELSRLKDGDFEHYQYSR